MLAGNLTQKFSVWIYFFFVKRQERQPRILEKLAINISSVIKEKAG